jgi:hypothetical protein
MSKNTKVAEGTLRVWHIPQVPMKPFHVDVKSVREAKLILDALAFYDIFQFKNNIKPDYCNAAGLEVFRDGDWEEWEDEESCEDIDHIDEERTIHYGIDEWVVTK